MFSKSPTLFVHAKKNSNTMSGLLNVHGPLMFFSDVRGMFRGVIVIVMLGVRWMQWGKCYG